MKHGIFNIKHSNNLRLITLCLIRMEICSKTVYSAFFNPFSSSVFFRERWYSLCVFPTKSKSRPSLLIKQRGKTIVLPLRWSLTTLVFRWRQRNLPKSVLHVQSFVLLITFAFCIFSARFHHCRCRGCSTSQNRSRYKTISLKNCRFKEKRATKTTSAGTHRLKGLSLKTCIQKNILISSS